MIGQKYNRLTAISRQGVDNKRQILWLFECECGKFKILRGTEVRRGIVKSCGCYMKEQTSKSKRSADLLGKKFGHLLVIERSHLNGSGKTLWTCMCLNCGTGVIKVFGYSLKRGGVKSCGCKGRGSQTHGTIYGIYKKDTDDLVYIGQTVKYNIEDRFKCHLKQCHNLNLKEWFSENEAEIKPLIENVKIENLDMMEKQLIKIVTSEYHPLLNIQHNK